MEEIITRRFGMKPEQLSVGAVLLTFCLGGGSLGLNWFSNNGVIASIKELRDTSIEVTQTLKGIDKAFERSDKRFDTVEKEVKELRVEATDKLRMEVADLKQRLAVLEQQMKDAKK